MIVLKHKPNISVDRVVRFCFKRFLGVMNKNNGSYPDPCGDVINALMEEYGISNDAAQDVYKPVYWVLMDEGVLEYYHCNGSYWVMKKNKVSINSLAKIVREKYRETMKERVEGAVR